MTRDRIIDLIARRYGLSISDASNIVDESIKSKFTNLDRQRQAQFNRKISIYSKAMQFA